MKQKIQIILAFILGIVVSSGVVYAVTLYQAKEVAYDNTSSDSTSTDVQSALDELYDMINAKENAKLNTVVLTKDGTGSVASSVMDTGKSGEKQIVYMFAGIVEFTNYPTEFSLQGSNDNSSWTTITSWNCSVNGSYQANPTTTSTITSEYRYFRTTINNKNGGSRSKTLIVAIM